MSAVQAGDDAMHELIEHAMRHSQFLWLAYGGGALLLIVAVATAALYVSMELRGGK